MQSPFIVNDQPLFLTRFPANQVTRSLQAWDSADEYLVNYVNESQVIDSSKTILVFNDSFGALSLSFPQSKVFSVTDSVVSQFGLKANAKQNNLDVSNLTLLTSLDTLPDQVDVIVFKIPKSKQLLEEQLSAIRQQYGCTAAFIAGDKAKNIHSSTLAIFEKRLGTTTTSLAVKKARLVFCQLDAPIAQTNIPQFKQWQTDDKKYQVFNYSNVFARDKLDIGARFFIEHLPTLRPNQHVIDLGCGNGVLGLYLLQQQPSIELTQVDESFMAVASAQKTLEFNFPEQASQFKFVANDCLTGFEPDSADHIVCNPPFHQQNAVTDHIAWQMFKDSYNVLKKGAKLTIVGNRQLGYHIKLKRIFGNSKLIASDKKFVILTAKK